MLAKDVPSADAARDDVPPPSPTDAGPSTSADLTAVEHLSIGIKGLSTENPSARLHNSAVRDMMLSRLPLDGDAAYYKKMDNPVQTCLASGIADALKVSNPVSSSSGGLPCVDSCR